MEEKAIACRTLALLLNTLHSGLASYLPAITQTLPPLLNSTFDDIKMAALASIPDLLTAISETVQDPASIEAYRQTFLSLIDLLLSFIADEPELDMLLPALQTLFYCMPSAVLQRNGPIPIMQGAEVARIIEVLHAALKASFERRRRARTSRTTGSPAFSASSSTATPTSRCPCSTRSSSPSSSTPATPPEPRGTASSH